MRSPKPVFDRIEASIPTNYQQFSPRDIEQDTLDERVTSDSMNDLFAILENLRSQHIAKESIAVITTSGEIKFMKDRGFFEKINLLADIDTSEHVRGLEFPIVVVYGLDVWDVAVVVNAYARATTRVIAIYNQAVLSGSAQEKDLFAVQLKKNPKVAAVLGDPWGFLLQSMNWSLIPAVNTPNIYWHQNFSAWLIKVSRYMTIQEELWGAHLLLTTEYPVILVRTENDFLSVSQITLPGKSLSVAVKVNLLKLASICNTCGNYCFRGANGDVLCCHCSNNTLAPFTNIDLKIFDTKFKSVPFLALQKFEQLPEQKLELIKDHVMSYFGGEEKLGYQSLLVYVGAEIVNMLPDSIISNKSIIDSFVSVFGDSRRLEFSQVVPTCTNYWIGRGWLKKIDKGIYRRTGRSPVRDPITD